MGYYRIINLNLKKMEQLHSDSLEVLELLEKTMLASNHSARSIHQKALK